jgi:hypothetical protein
MNQVQKAIDKTDGYIRQNEVANPFGHNVSAALVYKRVERIVVACTYVTREMGSSDALKAEVQKVCMALLQNALNLKDGFRASGKDATVQLVSTVRFLMTAMDMLRVSGFISDANAELLKQACGKVVGLLRSSQDTELAESVAFSEDFFGRGEVVAKESSVPSSAVQAPKPVATAEPVKPVVLSAPTARTVVPTKVPVQHVLVIKGNSDRRSSILAVIESRGGVTIKDIVAVLPGVSSKTIQRELMSMIQDGILTKTGDRRWTVYSRA